MKILKNITLLVSLAVVLLVGCKKDEQSSPSSSVERAGVAINTDPSYLKTLWPIPLGPYYANPFTTNGKCHDFWYTDKDTCNVTIKIHAALTNFNRGLRYDKFDYYQIYNSPTNATNGYLDIIKTVSINLTQGDFTQTTNINLTKDGRDGYNMIAGGAYPNLDTINYRYTFHEIRLHSSTTNAFYYNSFIVASHK